MDHGEHSHSWRENPCLTTKQSRSRLASPPRGRTRDHHDRCSESSPRTREDNSSSRAQRFWDDIPDLPNYDEEVNWGDDSTAAGCSIPPTSVAIVSEEMGTVIKNACTVRLEHADCLKIRNAYSLPQVTASRTPQLDSYLKPEISPAAKTTDKELATIQTHVLDALAPLSAIIEAQEGNSEQTVSAVTAAIKLLGNTNTRISHL